ncbi:cadherin-like domain-containing protein [Membranicola marinus]|uniref:Cadherin-like domain-containing protein n=1 Tax=Membranihabitans marinus TaxID=1227546 RepID=A0A953HWK1_9BACT|nr:Ig-like domain-containing protein [Membranihabitans marinus]MBY5957886.1 cadherin-like domain-containing protein [Membranihabitans marinus]
MISIQYGVQFNLQRMYSIVALMGLISLYCGSKTIAQTSNLVPNQYTPITTVNGLNPVLNSSDVSCSLFNGCVSNLENIAAQPGAAASMNANLGSRDWLEVQFNEVAPAGSWAGFVVESEFSIAARILITVSDGTVSESIRGGNLLAFGLPGPKEKIGFYTSIDFDRIRVTFEGAMGSLDVYYAEVKKFGPGSSLACSTYTTLANPEFAVIVESDRTGFSGVNLGAVSRPHDAVDNDTQSYAAIEMPVGLGSATGHFSIRDQVSTYPEGSFAGMDIDNPDFPGAQLLQYLTITTYLAGTQQEKASGENLLSIPSTTETEPNRQTVGFITTRDFDEVQITMAQTDTEIGTTKIFGMALKSFCSENIIGLGILNPDIKTTWVDVPVLGDVSTNDQPIGPAHYGPASPRESNPTEGALHLNANGSYDFTTSSPGVYRYDVPITVNGTITSRTLQITVLDGNSTSNPPVVNPDFGSGPQGTPIVINSVANDGPGNENIPLDTSSISIVTPPNNGTTSINTTTGEITYTPEPGFTGRDSLEYQICDQGTPANCGTAWQYFTVNPDGVDPWTDATDDYGRTPYGEPMTGNVSTNDVDPQGEPQTVTAQNFTEPGVGTFVLSADGSYTFTPAAGFSGAHTFTYTTCRTNDGSVCAQATVHVMVEQAVPDLTPTIRIKGLNFDQYSTPKDFIVNIFEVNNTPTEGPIKVRINKLTAFTISYEPNSGTSDVFGNIANENGKWDISENSGFITFTSKPEITIPGNSKSILGLTITSKEDTPVNTSQNITTTIVAGSGGEKNSSNNSAIVKITQN